MNGQGEQEVTSPSHYIFEQFQNSYQFRILFTNPEKILRTTLSIQSDRHDISLVMKLTSMKTTLHGAEINWEEGCLRTLI